MNTVSANLKSTSVTAISTDHSKIDDARNPDKNVSEEYSKEMTDMKKEYSGISKDGDTLELSKLATCSKETLKQLYNSRQITKQQFDKHMARFKGNDDVSTTKSQV